MYPVHRMMIRGMMIHGVHHGIMTMIMITHGVQVTHGIPDHLIGTAIGKKEKK